jgi:hypothetical protein
MYLTCCYLSHEELRNLDSSPNIIRMIKSRRMRWTRHVARMGETRNANMGKPEGKRPLGRPRRRWVGYIKIDVGEIGWDDMDWIELAQDRDQWRALVNTVMNLWVPYKCWEVPEWLHNWQLLRKGSAP